MVNLIPQVAKKKVTAEYWLRVVTAWFFLWSGALVISTVLLFPVFIFTSVQTGVNEGSARSAEETVAEYKAVAEEIEKTNEQAKSVIEDTRLTRAHSYIMLFESLENEGVVLSEIFFTKTGKGVEPVKLAGQAEDRESLAAFRDELLANEAVEKVDLPISNLAKDKDIQFNMTVTMNKN